MSPVREPVPSVVLIGASAGGIDPLIRLVEQLPSDIDAAVVIVVHIPADADSRLPEILGRVTSMTVAHAVDGERLDAARIYVAPPDRHLLVDDGIVRVVRGPRQNRHRPAIDALLRTGARSAGARTIAVILSGAAGDAVTGSALVARRGGLVIVQDPAEATFPGMPIKVLEAVPEAVVLSADRIAEAVASAVAARRVIAAEAPGPHSIAEEIEPMDEVRGPAPVEPGRPAYSCPDCGGVLEEVVDGGPLRFRCRVGHDYYADELSAAQWTTLEDALWSAVRGMEETAELSGRLARMATERGAGRAAVRHRDRRDEVLAQSRVIRDFLLSPDGAAALADPEGPDELARAAEG